MTNKELYQKTFSQVHSSNTVLVETFQKTAHQKRRGVKAVVAAAAVIAVLMGVTTAAVAGNWFGLRELILPEKQTLRYPLDPDTGTQAVETVDMIGLSGWSDSPEAKALAEWQNFLNKYDPNGEIVMSIGNEPTGLEAEYGEYLVYTREMANKLDEIVEKYGLKLHTESNVISHEELVYRVGGEFLGDGHGKYWAYIYEDGTFQFDGDVRVETCGLVDYQLRRSVKGTFDETVLNIIDVNDYREEHYETSSGETVLLALGSDKSMIFGDFPSCFVTVNVLLGENEGMTMEQLGEIADGVDFSVLKTVIEPDMRGDSVPEPVVEEPEPEDTLFISTGVTTEEAREFRETLSLLIADGEWSMLAEQFHYPVEILAGGGIDRAETPEELLPYLEERTGGERAALLAELAPDWPYTDSPIKDPPEPEDGGFIVSGGMIGVGDGGVWIAMADDRLCVVTMQGEGWSIHPADPSVRQG